MAEQKHQRPPFTMIILYIVLAGAILFASFPTPAPATKQVTYSEFLDAVHGGQLAAVRITSTDLVGTLKQTGKTAAPSGIRTPRVPAMDESVPHPHNPGSAGFTQYRSMGNHSGNHPLPWLHAIRALGAKPVSILDTASQ